MIYLMLAYEFFKAGLFAVGGGLATLPFLTQMSISHPDWFTQEMLANMVAISESTPGPLGVNMATYVGYTTAGIPGALTATFALVCPSVIIIMLIYKVLEQYKNSPLVQSVFSGLRPATTGLIAAAGFSVFKMSVYTANAAGFFSGIHWLGILFFLVLLWFREWKKTSKLHPIVFIAVGAAAGLLIAF